MSQTASSCSSGEIGSACLGLDLHGSLLVEDLQVASASGHRVVKTLKTSQLALCVHVNTSGDSQTRPGSRLPRPRGTWTQADRRSMWRIRRRDPTRPGSRPFEPVDLLTLKPGGISSGVVDSNTCWTWEHLPVSCLVHDVAERQHFIHTAAVLTPSRRWH